MTNTNLDLQKMDLTPMTGFEMQEVNGGTSPILRAFYNAPTQPGGASL